MSPGKNIERASGQVGKREHRHSVGRRSLWRQSEVHSWFGLVPCQHHMSRMCRATSGSKNQTQIVSTNLTRCGNEDQPKYTHHAFQTCTETGTAKVTHRPHGRPETYNIVHARQDNRNLDYAASKTELVPSRHHSTREVQIVVFLLRHCDLERTVASRDCAGIKPLHVVRLPVVQVDRLPVWVITWIKGPPVAVELI